MRMIKTCIPQRERGFFLCKFGEEEQSGNNTDAVFFKWYYRFGKEECQIKNFDPKGFFSLDSF